MATICGAIQRAVRYQQMIEEKISEKFKKLQIGGGSHTLELAPALASRSAGKCTPILYLSARQDSKKTIRPPLAFSRERCVHTLLSCASRSPPDKLLASVDGTRRTARFVEV